MNYPVWQLDAFGGGLIIALIAILHVYISHFAVGGGLFLVLTEIKGLREGSQEILEYVRAHTKFFLLLSMVLGGMTGVGIWFTIALISPAATSSLIHIFVFGWAMEWVFFLAEIVSLLLYYYTFDRLDPRKHLILGWIYFGSAWMSLFLINGIIGFMLTPGKWLENGNFWSGFFNPSFWPSLFFRTFMALMIAGLFGFLTSIRIKNVPLRHRLIRYCALWLLPALLLLLPSALWYKAALLPAQQEMIFVIAPAIRPFLNAFIWLTPLLIGGGLVMAVFKPQEIRKPLAWVMLILGLFYLGCFEFIREGARRPYIIHDYMFSTSITKAELPQVRQKGVLAGARWVKNTTITAENRMDAGKDLFNLLCMPCHSNGGLLNDIRPFAAQFTPQGMDAFLGAMGSANSYMPAFAGTAEEQTVLAEYLTTRLVPRPQETQPAISEDIHGTAPIAFNPETAEYLLLVSPDKGMYLTSEPNESGIDFSFGPPTLRAQVIQRGPSPLALEDGAQVTYRIDTSKGLLTGTLRPEGSAYVATLPELPALAADFRPYVMADIEAMQNGKLLAATRVKINISNEIGCRNCHGGPWRQQGRAGLSRETSAAILTLHDQRHQTQLGKELNSGKIVVCSTCHADSSRNAAGQTQLLSLSAAMHGFHATRIEAEQSCDFCHASSPHGITGGLEDLHAGLDLTCANCHGNLTEHAMALLKGEPLTDNTTAMLKVLAQRGKTDNSAVTARTPWTMQPDCLTCHKDFQPPEITSAFNHWTSGKKENLFVNRYGMDGLLLCASCHGPQHSIYPGTNPHNQTAVNFQPLQYQKLPYPIGADRGCAVCHTMDMDNEFHHPGSLSTFRNRKE